MSKPRTTPPERSQRAPGKKLSRAPFGLTHETPASSQVLAGKSIKPGNSLKSKIAESNRVQSKAPVRGLGALVNRRAADRLRNGYLWVYASDIESIQLPGPSSDAPPALLPVADSRGILLGTALYSPSSQIALRVVSREALDEAAWLTLLASRLRQAILRRRNMLDERNNACRLCFSEADELPGLIVDKYGDLVILQRVTQGLLSDGVRDTCVEVLREELAPTAILERPDPRLRELEGLPAANLEPLYVADGLTGAGHCADCQHSVQAQWAALRIRREFRTEDGCVSRPASELCRGRGMGANAGNGESGRNRTGA